MAADNKLLKTFNAWRGLDLRSSDLTRESEFASELKNVDYRATGAMNKRKGYQAKTQSRGGFGTATYSDINPTTGKITEKIITVDSDLWELSEETLTITYAGSETAYCSCFVDSDNNFYFDVYENDTRLLHKNLGVGLNESSPVVLSDLIADINALTDFSASASGSTAFAAAFLDVTDAKVVAPTLEIGYRYWSQVSAPTNSPTPFSGAQAKATEDDFENASFANMNGVIYIATGYDDLYKYDGQRVYKAGLPKANISGIALNGGGTEVPGTPEYIVEYEYIDAKGNLITGIESDPVSITAGGSRVDLTLDNILDTSGYDTDSSDLKIRIYRNKSGGTTYFFVDEVTNVPGLATQVYTDSTTDANLGAEFIVPIEEHALPGQPKYITVHQGVLVAGGFIDDVNRVSYSDIDSPEYFPAQRSFLVETNYGDKVSGLSPLGNSLFVFKDDSVHQITGELNESRFRVDLYGRGQIGCAAHHTIQEVNNNLMFLSSKGVYALNQSSDEFEEVSEIIEPVFTAFDAPFNLKKAVAVNWIDKDKYIVFLPSETNEYADGDSRTFAFDYFRKAWLEWTNINAMGNFAIKDLELHWTERRQDLFSLTAAYHLHKILDTGSTYDYMDHNEAISFIYKSHWESLEEPSMFKKFLRCKIHSLDASLDTFESDAFTIKLQTELNWIPSRDTEKFLDFSGGSLGWGDSPWGEFPWGNERLTALLTKLKTNKCKSLRLNLTNSNNNENILVSGYEFEIAAPYRSFIKE